MIQGGDDVVTPHWPGFLLTTLVSIAICQAAPSTGEERAPVAVGRTTLTVQDLDRSLAFWRDALWVPGVTVVSEPVLIEYPSPLDEGTTPVLVSVFYDPDRCFVELNKLLGEPAGRPCSGR